MKRKAQGGEMIGMLVIIILIIVIIGVYIRFASMPHEGTVSTSVTDLQNDKMFNAMLEATVCEANNLEEVIKKCSKSQEICNQDSCVLMKESLDEMLDSLLGKRLNPELKQTYFFVEIGNKKVYEIGYDKIENDCLNMPNGKYQPKSYEIRPNVAVLTIARCVI
ncbi:MAG: hypothetical protein KKB39_00945 [Nanoarchaeota archaeon]|nr:hypothetical protein [Nanoarchaeota archaeon]